ncbi:MAG: hypothetical protein ACOX6L_05740 [Syntrophomonadaceae bacterium]|jgi:hypothetical protein
MFFGRKKKKDEPREESLIERGLRECGGDRVTMAWLVENTDGYDDVVEMYYQKKWDLDDPSWECKCGHWSDTDTCPHCGGTQF